MLCSTAVLIVRAELVSTGCGVRLADVSAVGQLYQSLVFRMVNMKASDRSVRTISRQITPSASLVPRAALHRCTKAAAHDSCQRQNPRVVHASCISSSITSLIQQLKPTRPGKVSLFTRLQVAAAAVHEGSGEPAFRCIPGTGPLDLHRCMHSMQQRFPSSLGSVRKSTIQPHCQHIL